MIGRLERPRARAAAVGIALMFVGLVGAFLVKDQCVGAILRSPGYTGIQYSRGCYSDVYVLWFFRSLDAEPIPYIHGDGAFAPDTGEDKEAGDLEYPAGTGVLVAIAALLARDAVSFFVWSALLLGASGLIAAAWLTQMVGDRRRILYLAFAPTLLLYGFHNWDLFALACMCGAMYAWWRKRDGVAGALAGIGAAAKIFPGLIVPALALAAWREDRARARRLVTFSIVAFLAVNVPFAIVNVAGWWGPWDFQSTRFPNYDSTWFMLYRRLRPNYDGWRALSSQLSVLLFLASAAVLLVREARRPEIRPYLLSFQVLVVFLLTSKIFSPQFALWLLPFFVVLSLPWYAFVIFTVTEASVWFAIGKYFNSNYADSQLNLTEAAVWARFAMLLWLLAVSHRARELVLPRRPGDTSEEPQVTREEHDSERADRGERH